MKLSYLKKHVKQFGQLSVIALALCGTKMAFAGDRGGNGGDALICQDRVILLDYFEAENHELTIDIEGSDLREKVGSMIQKLAKFDKLTAKLIKEYTDEMVIDIENKERDSRYKTKVVKLSTNVVLSDVDDSYEHALPIGCEKKQLVIQKQPIVPEDRLYEIDKNIWDSMDLVQKAMTITHEAWYRYHLSLKAKDSRFTRYINGFFASKEAEESTFLEYAERLKKAPLLTQGMIIPDIIRMVEGVEHFLRPEKMVVTKEAIHFVPAFRDYIKLLEMTWGTETLTIGHDGENLAYLLNGTVTNWEIAGLKIAGTKCNLQYDLISQIKSVTCGNVSQINYNGKTYQSQPYEKGNDDRGRTHFRMIGKNAERYKLNFKIDQSNKPFDVAITNFLENYQIAIWY